ncbi:MAG: hypothetical protein PUK59_01405 [Actinomycetaceae bacterium]|nr:hypothetical protein [Actinomycetaceae bacterium]MDY5854044.1 DUF6541 family protein [Arcanobacterium sp.]
MLEFIAMWAAIIVPAVQALALLWLPGYLILRTARVHRFLAFTLAPLTAAFIIGIFPIVYAAIHLPWNIWSFLLAVGLLWLLAYAVRQSGLVQHAPDSTPYKHRSATDALPTKKASPPGTLRNSWSSLRWTITGTLCAFPLSTAGYTKGLESPFSPSQTWDAAFHESAIEWIKRTGDASTLHLAAVSSNLPESQAGTGGFYPSGFHALVALIPGDTILITNAVVAVITLALWPIAIGCLTAYLEPRNRYVQVVAPLLASVFTSFPERPMSYGVLWPTVYAYALIPLLLVAVAWWLEPRSADPPLRYSFLPLLIAAALGIAIVHPTGILSAFFALLALCAHFFIRTYRVAFHNRRTPAIRDAETAGNSAVTLSTHHHNPAARTTAVTAVHRSKLIMLWTLIALACGGLVLASRTSLWTHVSSWGRVPKSSVKDAIIGSIFEAQLPALTYGDAELDLLLGLFTLAGVGFALVKLRYGWLVASWAWSIYLFTLAAAVNVPGFSLVGPWYADAVRLGAIIPIFAAPLAAIGLGECASYGVKKWGELAHSRLTRLEYVTLVVIIAIVTTGVLGVRQSARQLFVNYKFYSADGFNATLSPSEVKMLRSIPNSIKNNGMLLGDPRQGASYAYALSGMDVSFRHMSGSWDPDMVYLAQNAHKIKSDPKICSIIRAYNIRYLYADSITYWPENEAGQIFDGIDKLSHRVDILTPVLKGNDSVIYRINYCGLE